MGLLLSVTAGATGVSRATGTTEVTGTSGSSERVGSSEGCSFDSINSGR